MAKEYLDCGAKKCVQDFSSLIVFAAIIWMLGGANVYASGSTSDPSAVPQGSIIYRVTGGSGFDLIYHHKTPSNTDTACELTDNIPSTHVTTGIYDSTEVVSGAPNNDCNGTREY